MTTQDSIWERTPGGTPPLEARESIWSVPPGRMAQYFGLFTVLASAGIGFQLWYEIFENTADTLPQTVQAIIQGVGVTTVGAGGLALLIFEGPRFFMVMADYFTKRWLNPLKDKLREEGRAEGRAEGHSAGRAEGHSAGRAEGHSAGRAEGHSAGRAEERAEWATWLDRRTAAEANGEPFDEPPPSANSHG